jgi:hypothetical protein
MEQFYLPVLPPYICVFYNSPCFYSTRRPRERATTFSRSVPYTYIFSAMVSLALPSNSVFHESGGRSSRVGQSYSDIAREHD